MNIDPVLLHNLAWTKIVLIVVSTLVFVMYARQHSKPLDFLILLTTIFVIFGYLVVAPLQSFLFGNTGDELYIGALLSHVIHRGFSGDFYYALLPGYYPPLYFWIVGYLSSFVTTFAHVAFKIGVMLSTATLFLGTYMWFGLARILHVLNLPSIIRILIPTLFIILIPYDAFIGKPHEAIGALFSIFLVAIIIQLLRKARWTYGQILFVALSGSGLFLMFYFWGLAMLPVVIFFVLMAVKPSLQFLRLFLLLILVFSIAFPFLSPLVVAYSPDISLAQGTFFSVRDVLFFPGIFNDLSTVLLATIGLVGLLLFHQIVLVRAGLAMLVGVFVHQFIGLLLFVLGYEPILPSKPVLYMMISALAIGLSYALVAMYFIVEKFERWRIFYGLMVGCVLLISSPFIRFGENHDIIEQLHRSYQPPQEFYLAQTIERTVPDWKERIWFASTRPAVNVYIPLQYYIAHNEHHSHPFADFTTRLSTIEALVSSPDAESFITQFDTLNPKPDSLLLFYDPERDAYPLHFWVDNFPNGGREYVLYLPAYLIDDAHWEHVYDEWGWNILLRKHAEDITS